MDLIAKLNVDVRGPGGAPAPVQAGEVVVFYFSAHWCPPCKQFTPLLAKVYALSAGSSARDGRYTPTPPQPLHVIFVSGDKSEPEMKAYMAESHGRWSYVTFGSPGVQALNAHFNVQGIPSVSVCAPSGAGVVRDARSDIMQCGGNAAAVAALVQQWRTAAGVRPDVIPSGVQVELCGLSKEDMNGQLCKVTGADLASDRVRVCTPANKVIAVRRGNCSQKAFGSVKGEVVELSANPDGYSVGGETVAAAEVVPAVGTVVCIHGLQAKPEKNGVWGAVRAFDAAAGRVEVEVSPTEVMRLRPANLSLAAVAPAAPAAAPPPKDEDAPADNFVDPSSL